MGIGLIAISVAFTWPFVATLDATAASSALNWFEEQSNTKTTIVLLVLLFTSQFLGTHIVALGETMGLSLLHGEKIARFKERIEIVEKRAVGLTILQAAFAGYRLTCATGVVVGAIGAAAVIESLSGEPINILIGISYIFLSALIIFRYSRVPFAVFDLIFFGDIHE